MSEKSYITLVPRGDDNRSKRGHTNGNEPPGGEPMEARVARLETHVEYIRRDLDEMSEDLKDVKTDLLSIKRRIAYFSGAGLILAVIIGWVFNNRFEQILSLLSAAPK